MQVHSVNCRISVHFKCIPSRFNKLLNFARYGVDESQEQYVVTLIFIIFYNSLS